MSNAPKFFKLPVNLRKAILEFLEASGKLPSPPDNDTPNRKDRGKPDSMVFHDLAGCGDSHDAYGQSDKAKGMGKMSGHKT